MDMSNVSRVMLLTVLAVVAHSLSVDEISQRHYQLSMDTFQYFEEQLRVQQAMLEERIRRLEGRVTDLELRPVVRPGLPHIGDGGRGVGDADGGGDNGPEPTEAPGQPATKKPQTTMAPTTIQPTTKRATTTEPLTLRYEATCAHIYNNGYTTSGDYTIDPDGFGENSPYTVYCDMDQGEGITIVGHNSEEENIPVRGFEDPGSFILEPTYINSATMRQLGALADASLECEQYVKYACKNSGLMEIHRKSGLTYAWWVDRYGQKHVNFGGAGTDTGMCACGVTSTCFKGSSTCNCDHPTAKNQIDEGYFTDKDLLPILSINLGDTGSKKERGAVTLGKFVCKG